MTNKSVQLYGKTNDLQDETRQAHRDDPQFTGWLVQDQHDDLKEILSVITLILCLISAFYFPSFQRWHVDIHSTKMG